MNILQTPTISQEELRNELRVMREASKEVFSTVESGVAHLLKIGAINEALAADILARKGRPAKAVPQRRKRLKVG